MNEDSYIKAAGYSPSADNPHGAQVTTPRGLLVTKSRLTRTSTSHAATVSAAENGRSFGNFASVLSNQQIAWSNYSPPVGWRKVKSMQVAPQDVDEVNLLLNVTHRRIEYWYLREYAESRVRAWGLSKGVKCQQDSPFSMTGEKKAYLSTHLSVIIYAKLSIR